MALVFFHGEGILFSTLIHTFFGLIAGAALLFGVLKFRSAAGILIALAYITISLVGVWLSQKSGHSQLGNLSLALTLPWSLILPCYNLDRSCPLTLGVAFICVEINAAVLYFLVVFGSLLKDRWSRGAAI